MNAQLNHFPDLIERPLAADAESSDSLGKIDKVAMRQLLRANPWGTVGEDLVKNPRNRAQMEARVRGKNTDQVLGLESTPLPYSVVLIADLNGFSAVTDVMTNIEKHRVQANIQKLSMDLNLNFGVPLLRKPPGDKWEMPIKVSKPLSRPEAMKLLALARYLHTNPVPLGLSEARREELQRTMPNFDQLFPGGNFTISLGLDILEENTGHIGGVIGPESSDLGVIFVYGDGLEEIEGHQMKAGKGETIIGPRLTTALARMGIALPKGDCTKFLKDKVSDKELAGFEVSREANIAAQERRLMEKDPSFPMAPYLQLLFSRDGFEELKQIVENSQKDVGRVVSGVIEDTNTLGRTISVLALPDNWKHSRTPQFMKDLVSAIAQLNGADIDVPKVDGHLIFLNSSVPPKENLPQLLKLSALLYPKYPEVAMTVGYSTSMARLQAGHVLSPEQDFAGNAYKYSALTAKFSAPGDLVLHGEYAILAGINREWTPFALKGKSLTLPVVRAKRSEKADITDIESRKLLPETVVGTCISNILLEVNGGRKIVTLLPELERAEIGEGAERAALESKLMGQRGYGLSAIKRRVKEQIGTDHQWVEVADSVEGFRSSEYPVSRSILKSLLPKGQEAKLQLPDAQLRDYILSAGFFGTDKQILFVLDDLDPSASDWELIQVLMTRSSPSSQFLISGMEQTRNRNGQECTRVLLPEQTVESLSDIVLQHCVHWQEDDRLRLRPLLVERLRKMNEVLRKDFALTPRFAAQLFAKLTIRGMPILNCDKLPEGVVMDDLNFDMADLHVPVGAYAREIEQKLPRGGLERQFLFLLAQFPAPLPIAMATELWTQLNAKVGIQEVLQKLEEEGFVVRDERSKCLLLGRESARNLICSELYTESSAFLAQVRGKISDYFFANVGEGALTDESARYQEACLRHIFAKHEEPTKALPVMEQLLSFYETADRPIDALRLYQLFCRTYEPSKHALKGSFVLGMARSLMDYGERAEDKIVAAQCLEKLLEDSTVSAAERTEAKFFLHVHAGDKINGDLEGRTTLLKKIEADIQEAEVGSDQRFILECLLLRNWAKITVKLDQTGEPYKILGYTFKEHAQALRSRLAFGRDGHIDLNDYSASELRAVRIFGAVLMENPLNKELENWELAETIHASLNDLRNKSKTLITHEGINNLHDLCKATVSQPFYLHPSLQKIPGDPFTLETYLSDSDTKWIKHYNPEEAATVLDAFLSASLKLPWSVYRRDALCQAMNFMELLGVAAVHSEEAKEIFLSRWDTFSQSIPELIRKIPAYAAEFEKVQNLRRHILKPGTSVPGLVEIDIQPAIQAAVAK